MLLLKACGKCHGDMTNDFPDTMDRFCLQCGERNYALAPLPYTRSFEPGDPKKHRKARAAA